MHNPAVFRIEDPATISSIVDAYSFGILIVQGEDGFPEASHLPFVFDPSAPSRSRLWTHCARANPIAHSLRMHRTALVVFSGPDGYVSPMWYRDPTEQVPTWNYLAVHARVRVQPLSDPQDVRAVLSATVAKHEDTDGQGWRLATAPQLVEELLPSIAAFALEVERWDGKAKLSQNRDPDDRDRVRSALALRARPDDMAMLHWWDAARRPDGADSGPRR